jgi:hypothetical protein
VLEQHDVQLLAHQLEVRRVILLQLLQQLAHVLAILLVDELLSDERRSTQVRRDDERREELVLAIPVGQQTRGVQHK